MAKPKAAKTSPGGYYVRLRGEKHPLPVAVSIEGKQDQRAKLMPGKKTEVTEDIYVFLKSKYGGDRTMRLVPDFDENYRNPHASGTEPIMREEERPGYIIEFLSG